jgi:aspartyl-tRNA synthetase
LIAVDAREKESGVKPPHSKGRRSRRRREHCGVSGVLYNGPSAHTVRTRRAPGAAAPPDFSGFRPVLRTHTCGELRRSHEGETVTLCGWVDRHRVHPNAVFIDLRDRYGTTQVVARFQSEEEAAGSDLYKLASSLRSEDVICARGRVAYRGEGVENPRLETGQIEVVAESIEVLNRSKPVPFRPWEMDLPNEELRLRYRFIDLRREELQRNMRLRHEVCRATRDYFNSLGFLEIETPMLGRSTPEGARDYLVPSRVHPGSFYALPQSPQIYKQILMVAGYDRYYQLARCFRDEDLRADRQPEFTQIDVEMAFVERDDILETIDGLIAALFRDVRGEEIKLPLPRYTYQDVMERYGSDKPDLRFGMELVDIGEIARECGFGVFRSVMESGGRVRGICAPAAAEKYSRRVLDNDLKNLVGEYGAKGLAYFKVSGGLLESSIAKFFTEDQQRAIVEKMGGKDGDLLLFVADKPKVTSAALSALRNRLGRELELYDPQEMSVAWVIDFPLVTWNEDENRWDAEHHPFCSVLPEDEPYLTTDPARVRAASYDLVCNGYEAASGSVRIHDPAVQQRVFDLIGIEAEEAERRFGFLLEALRYGAPPHAGIALGLDRWVMLFTGDDNIRDVIAFPKTQKASDLLSGAPAPVDTKQLRELHIKTDVPAPQ